KAYRPESIPMDRLAKYMLGYAALLGNEKSVHFDRLESGSTRIVAAVEFEDIPKVRTRLDSAKRGDAPSDVLKAQGELDKLLADDNASGYIEEETDTGSAKVIAFPGATKPRPVQYGPFTQEGSLDGVLTSITGADDTIHVQLQNGSLKYTGIVCNEDIGRRLGKHFREPVRIHGSGRWLREEDGTWTLRSFRIESFSVLKNDDLRDVVDQLRAVRGSEWGDDPLAKLEDMRSDKNGMH
ncbi:MAG: hypothetical protein AAGB04_24580, partial [Pseudomonadota bacterium]